MSQENKGFSRAEVCGKQLTRSISLQRDAAQIDEESRTAELAFSSDAPIYHWFGFLILDHAASSIRLDRLKESGAVLWNHHRDQQIGGIESVGRSDDGKCRATVKFSRSRDGEEALQDVADGIKRSVSMGFCIYDLEPEPGADGKQRMIDGEPVYRSRDWEPFEISLVSIPADTSVGIGRSLDQNNGAPADARRENSITNTENEMKENENLAPAGALDQQQQRAAQTPTAPPPVNAEVQRAADFTAFGREFGEEELARTLALDEKTTLADVRAAIVEKRKAAQTPVQPAPVESIAARSGADSVQLARSVYRGGPLRSFRGERAEETAYRMGQWFLAALARDAKAIEFCREKGIPLNRTQTGTSNEKGGFLVPDEFENVMIDLRIQYGVFRPNANVVPMTTDTKTRPRRTGGLTAYPIGAGQKIEKSEKNWDRVQLIARKWGVLAKYEEEFSEDSVINVADDLASEIAYAFTQKEDECGFNGDGTSAFHGIVGVIQKLAAATAGLKTASGNAWSEITEADLLGVIGLLPQFARRSGMVKWYCSHTFWANVLQRIALAKGGVSYAEINGELKEVFMGKPVEIVEVMPTTEANAQIPLLYGNLSQAAMFGDRRGVTVRMTDSNDTDFEEEVMSIRGTERFDINVHDVGSTTVAGPVVGLITAGS